MDATRQGIALSRCLSQPLRSLRHARQVAGHEVPGHEVIAGAFGREQSGGRTADVARGLARRGRRVRTSA